MQKDGIPHDDFQAGFVVGYQAIRGTAVSLPGIPGRPGTPSGSTPFLQGVRAGLRAAGVTLPE